MGSALGTAAGKVGGALGNTIFAPFKSFFTKTCEDKCGEWDGFCYIENACIASLFRLFIAYGLVIMTVLFLYIMLWKTGIVKCLIKKSCKLSWKAFWGCFHGLCGACGVLWHKLRNTKRVYRGRRSRRDVEMGESGWSNTDWSGSISVGSRKRRRSPVSVRERRKDRVRQSLGPIRRQFSKVGSPGKRSRTEQSQHHHPHHHRATEVRMMEASSSHYVHGSPRREH